MSGRDVSTNLASCEVSLANSVKESWPNMAQTLAKTAPGLNLLGWGKGHRSNEESSLKSVVMYFINIA